MNDAKPVFIADSCIGGLSVINTLWQARRASHAVFLADYAINPLGVKDEPAIAEVVSRWLSLAEEHSDTLIIACNTLSIRYRHLSQSGATPPGLKQIVSMVECFEAMVGIGAERLANKKVLVIGTEYTASQTLYLDLLRAAVPGIHANAIAASDLERKVARFQPGPLGLGEGLGQAIRSADVVVLACTCFPIILDELKSMFPDVIFLDPGAYCAELLYPSSVTGQKQLRIAVTGNIVATKLVTSFAENYLNADSIIT